MGATLYEVDPVAGHESPVLGDEVEEDVEEGAREGEGEEEEEEVEGDDGGFHGSSYSPRGQVLSLNS